MYERTTCNCNNPLMFVYSEVCFLRTINWYFKRKVQLSFSQRNWIMRFYIWICQCKILGKYKLSPNEQLSLSYILDHVNYACIHLLGSHLSPYLLMLIFSSYSRYIKDYDGGILMECRIDPKLPYTDLSTMIRRQRQVRFGLCCQCIIAFVYPFGVYACTSWTVVGLAITLCL